MTFYLSTAIDYANGQPHLGHAYEKVLADVIARLHLGNGEAVYLLTGLDEHGQKVQQSALGSGESPQVFCDRAALNFQKLCKVFGIQYSRFIRTSELSHQKFVQGILEQLREQGDLYEGKYQGFYSTRAEQFLTEKEKVQGAWPAIYGEVVEVSEPAWFFKLRRHQGWLVDYIKRHRDWIYPHFRAKEVLQFLQEPLNDLCISRPKERVSWGIPLPFAPDFVCYVWLDALSNYLSFATEFWPADLHIIGKDILKPSHAVYWPILLKALGKSQPKGLLVHGFWNLKGRKMSKSLGEVVDPFQLAATFQPDALRYFFLREMRVGFDSNFSQAQLSKRYHEDLGNDLGNLISRFASMVHRYAAGTIPKATYQGHHEQAIITAALHLAESVPKHNGRFDFQESLKLIFGFITRLNTYVERRAPWRLAKEAGKEEELKTALATLAEGLRLVAVQLLPFLPTSAQGLHKLLGLETPRLCAKAMRWEQVPLAGKSIGEKPIFFPRVDLELPAASHPQS